MRPAQQIDEQIDQVFTSAPLINTLYRSPQVWRASFLTGRDDVNVIGSRVGPLL